MAKLNMTQVNYIVETLENTAVQTIDQIVVGIKSSLMPPKLSDKEILKAIYKQVSDTASPKGIRWLLEGRPYPMEKERLVERDTIYQQIAQLETQMNLVAENYIRKTKGKLLFEDTWESGVIPEYLMYDLVSELMDFVQPEDDD